MADAVTLDVLEKSFREAVLSVLESAPLGALRVDLREVPVLRAGGAVSWPYEVLEAQTVVEKTRTRCALEFQTAGQSVLWENAGAQFVLPVLSEGLAVLKLLRDAAEAQREQLQRAKSGAKAKWK